MNITSAEYVYDTDTNTKYAIIAVIDGVTMSVPIDNANRHYQAIQEWISEGNTVIDNPPE
jgi:hypothetical protein